MNFKQKIDKKKLRWFSLKLKISAGTELSFIPLILALCVFALAPVVRADAPEIFILKSTGVCQGCAEAISKMLFTEGIKSQILGPEQLMKNVRPRDLLIIGGGVPGGEGEWTIKQDLQKVGAFTWLKKHIQEGGRYFGICAGAYLAEEWIDKENGIAGLNIFPGMIDNYTQDKSAQLLSFEVLPEKSLRSAYFQDGPAFYPAKSSAVEVVARFAKDKTAAAVLFSYHKGKVGLLSPHFEADGDWFSEANLKDKDGLEYRQGIHMIKRLLTP